MLRKSTDAYVDGVSDDTDAVLVDGRAERLVAGVGHELWAPRLLRTSADTLVEGAPEDAALLFVEVLPPPSMSGTTPSTILLAAEKSATVQCLRMLASLTRAPSLVMSRILRGCGVNWPLEVKASSLAAIIRSLEQVHSGRT